MRILFDLQGIQGRSGSRGIGQYSYEGLKALCQQLMGHEIYFLVNNDLEISPERVREIRTLRPNATWLGINYPVIDDCFTADLKIFAQEMRKEVVKILAPDWVHIFSVVEGYSEPVVGHSFGEFISTAVFHDAIPAIYPEKFLSSPAVAEWYWERIATFRGYDAIFANSSTSEEEAVKYLEIRRSIVKTIWGGLNHEKFRNLESQDHKHITYIGSFEERKNLPRLIEAFADSIPYLEDSTNLILVGKYHGPERQIIEDVIKANKLEDRVSIRGYILDSEMDSIFRETKLIVLPSLHEGLGLPLLEAMGQGIPAIASNVSSMKIILNGLDNSFDPLSVDSISEKIQQFMNSQESREKLIQEFNKRRTQYTWQKAAEELLSVVFKLPKKENLGGSFNKSGVRTFLKNSIARIVSSELDSQEREVAIRALSTNFKNLLDLAPSANLHDPTLLTLGGHFTGSYSLSQLNRNVYKASKHMNVESTFIPEYYNSDTKEYSIDSAFNPKEFNFISEPQNLEVSTDSIFMRNAYPPIANDMQGCLNLYHTYNWEETEFPQEYVAEFNYFLDGITLATSFVQKTLIDNGVGIPTRVVGASSCVSIENEPDNLRKKLNSEKFTFLHISSAFPRKGIDILLESYGQAFSAQDSVKLIIKTFPNPHNEVNEQLSSFKARYPNHAEITLINRELSNEEILQLYSLADCLVCPSRGEGFGLPMYEALTFGIPVIATNWGGHKDFVTSDNGMLIDFSFMPSATHLGSSDSVWAEPNVSSLVKCLKEMLLNPKEVRFQTDTWVSSIARTLEFAQGIAGQKPIKPKTAWVTTFNTRCGIAEYSKGLIENYPEEDVVIFPPLSGTPIDCRIESNVRRIWVEKGNLSLLSQEILAAKVNTVIVQHNWGFFVAEEFNNFVINLSKELNVILEMHSLKGFNLKAHPDLIKILPSMQAVTRIIVHDIQDLNLLKSYELIENVVFIPLAFPNITRELDYSLELVDEIVIGTSGFALPNKNQELLIDVALSLREVYRKVKVMYFCPLHTDPSSVIQVKKLEDLAKRNPSVEIVINTDFLSDDEILNSLSSCDLLIYPYKDSTETSSAAVRHGISSGVPTIVSPATIFDSNRDIVFTTDGYGAEEIFRKVLDVIELLANKKVANDYSMRVQNKVIKNSRLNTSLRIQRMSQGLLNMKD